MWWIWHQWNNLADCFSTCVVIGCTPFAQWLSIMASSNGNFSALPSFCAGIHRSPVVFPHKGTATRNFDVYFLTVWTNFEQILAWPVIRDAMMVIWRRRNGYNTMGLRTNKMIIQSCHNFAQTTTAQLCKIMACLGLLRYRCIWYLDYELINPLRSRSQRSWQNPAMLSVLLLIVFFTLMTPLLCNVSSGFYVPVMRWQPSLLPW